MAPSQRARAEKLIADGADAFNDKNTLTADPAHARFVYAVWDRLVAGAEFSRTRATESRDGRQTILNTGAVSTVVGGEPLPARDFPVTDTDRSRDRRTPARHAAGDGEQRRGRCRGRSAVLRGAR